VGKIRVAVPPAALVQLLGLPVEPRREVSGMSSSSRVEKLLRLRRVMKGMCYFCARRGKSIYSGENSGLRGRRPKSDRKRWTRD